MTDFIQTLQTSLGPVSYRLVGEGPRKILFFHGFPGSSSQIRIFNSSLELHQIQALCFDRPGYNQSDLFVDDMLGATLSIGLELVKKLGWSRFEVVTVSGGTPYGISFAQKYPELVSRIRVLCGLGYLKNENIRKYFSALQIFSLKYLRYFPGPWLQKIMTRQKKSPDQRNALFEFFYPVSAADRATVIEKKLRASLDLTLAEAVRLQGRGPKLDTKVFLSDWGKDLSRLTTPIHFWHGDEDLVIHPAVSEQMACLIPGAGLTIVPGEGHLSLPIRQTAKILQLDF